MIYCLTYVPSINCLVLRFVKKKPLQGTPLDADDVNHLETRARLWTLIKLTPLNRDEGQTLLSFCSTARFLVYCMKSKFELQRSALMSLNMQTVSHERCSWIFFPNAKWLIHDMLRSSNSSSNSHASIALLAKRIFFAVVISGSCERQSFVSGGKEF